MTHITRLILLQTDRLVELRLGRARSAGGRLINNSTHPHRPRRRRAWKGEGLGRGWHADCPSFATHESVCTLGGHPPRTPLLDQARRERASIRGGPQAGSAGSHGLLASCGLARRPVCRISQHRVHRQARTLSPGFAPLVPPVRPLSPSPFALRSPKWPEFNRWRETRGPFTVPVLTHAVFSGKI